MNYLLDTNVISESRKKEAHSSLVSWLNSIPNEGLYISVLSIGEIRYGVEKLSDSEKKEALSIWLNFHIPEWFGDHILPIDSHIMNKWGILCSQYKTLPIIDSMLAATAIMHHLTLVTRNIKDFENIQGLSLFNPWDIKIK